MNAIHPGIISLQPELTIDIDGSGPEIDSDLNQDIASLFREYFRYRKISNRTAG